MPPRSPRAPKRPPARHRWRKAPDALVALFDAVFPDHPGAERRTMFGYPCGFVHGNMFGGLWQEHVILRLDEPGRRRIAALGGAPFEPMGRPMREYVVAGSRVTGDRRLLRSWLGRALAHTAELPPKPGRQPGPRRLSPRSAQSTSSRPTGTPRK